ncbi:helix-turn-helix transcriptional regulator [Salmonella enterica]|nr:helix-turn-helix transcriptional regulator [Salmonella enterica]
MAYLNHRRCDLLNELFPQLTEIQTQCVLMYSLGLSAVEISEAVGVSRQMIDKNLHAAAKKMNVHSVIGIKPAVQIGLMFTILDKLKDNKHQTH